MDKKEMRNEFVARGVLLHKGYDKNNVYIFRVVIPGLKKNLYLDMRYEGKDRPNVKSGNHIVATGYVRGYSVENKKGERRSTQYLVATNIVKDASLLEEKFGVEGHYYSEGSFKAYTIGMYIKSDVMSDTIDKITLKTQGGPIDKRESYVELMLNKKKRWGDLDYHRGDVLCVVANASHYFPGLKSKEEVIDFKDVRHAEVTIKNSLYLEDIVTLEKLPEPKETPVQVQAFNIIDGFKEDVVLDEPVNPFEGNIKAVAEW